MSYRPKHPLIVVVNADGSGYTLQFSTLAEAKTAYASIQTTGVAYLYPSARKSLAEGDGYADIPEYNNGMTYGTGALVSLNGTVYRLINFIGAGGYGPITHPSAWTTDVVLPRALPAISSTGLNDGARRGMTFTTAQNISFTPDECPPAGTILEEANISPIIIPIYGQQVEVGTTVYNLVADGACDSYEVTTSVGYVPNGTLVASDSTNNYFSNGEGGYYLEALPPCDAAGTQITGTGGNYTVDVGCGEYILGTYYDNTYADGACGTYNESGSNYVPAGTSIGICGTNDYISNGDGTYYPQSGCEDGSLHSGEAGWTYDGCYWSYVEPCPQSGTQLSSNSESYDVEFGCGTYSSGTYGSITYADGNCGTYIQADFNYVESGTLLANCNDYNYRANGSGGYYQGEYTGGPSCEAGGTFIEEDSSSSDITANNPCGSPFLVGDSTYFVYADGNCGTYSESGNNYLSNGTFLGSCGSDNYYSDGAGSAYSYVAAGTSTGNTYNGTNYITINGSQYDNGTFSSNEYHDGNGGYYTEAFELFQSYGYNFTSTTTYDEETMMDVLTYYNSDGSGGYYTSNE